MRIVIVGLGQTGQELAKELIYAGHEIIVIDTNKNLIENFTNHYDAIGVVGSGASKEIQLKAKANNADVMIALSPTDEVNLMSCITAKLLGTKRTIARVTAAEYVYDEAYLTKNLGIDMIINPEYETAKQITRILRYSNNIKANAFANGKVDVVELKIKEDSPLLGLKLDKIKAKFKEELIIAAIIRGEKLIIPRGDAEIKLDDEVYIITKDNEMCKLLKSLKLIEKPIKSVFMIGCGKIGTYLLKNFSHMKLKTKVVEFDKERCIETAEAFPDVMVIHGNGVDSDMLIEEGLKEYDACVAITGEDEINIVVTLFAWSHKVRKLVTKVVSVSYSKMLNNVDIDNTLSPHLIVLSSIHRFIRGITGKGVHVENIKSLHRFAKNTAEAIEFEVKKDFAGIGQKLKEIKLKKDIVIAFIIRDNKVIMPNGETTFEENDRVIVIASAEKNIGNLMEIIEE